MNRSINDPGNLDTYQHQSYHKMVFTLKATDDGEVGTNKEDLLKGGHLFLSKSFSEVKYKKPGRRNETVKSSKISGIQEPVVALVSSSFEPFSFYQDQVERFSLEFSQIPIQNWKLSLTASNEKRNPLWTLPGLIDGGAAFRDAFQAVELGLNVNYIYRERNSRIGKRILPGPAEYPLMQMHLSKAFPEILGSDVDFWRMVLRIQHQWKQGLSLHHFNMIGMGIWGDNSPILYFNTGFGIRSEDRNLSLSWPGYLQTMDKGYFESGVELQNIIKYKSGFGFQGLGLGAYYRWGAYANPTWQENIFFNLSFNVSF